MNWKPLIDPGDKRVIDFLTDFDIKRIRKLESNYHNTSLKRDKLKIEKEILDIYLVAIERGKNRKRTLGDWLNEEEKIKIKELREKLTHSDRPFHYEGMIYQVYLESIIRQSTFSHEEDVRKYIGLMKQTESNEKAERVARKIMNLLRNAGGGTTSL